jgi:phosphopantetheine adenylyltransferase
MYERKVVSPKPYSIQLLSLQQRHQHSSEKLDNYKKHAAELTKLLSDIKKEREEIASIDEVIRTENWDQTKNIKLLSNEYAGGQGNNGISAETD